MGTGTFIIIDPLFNAIGNGFIPDLPLEGFLPGRHKLTLIIGLIAIIFSIYSAIKSRKTKQSYNFTVPSLGLFMVELVLIAALIRYITWILSGYN